MSSKFTEINATVLEQTAMAIEKYTKKYNLSTGEVIDKLLLNFCTNDPDLAAQFICQFFISTISKQIEEQKKKTLLKTIAFLTVPLMMDNTNNITYPKQMKASFRFARISYQGVSRGGYILCVSKRLCERSEHSNRKF